MRATAMLAAAVAALVCWPAASGASSGKGRPYVTTGGVSHTRGAAVTLGGSVDPHGLATTWYFVYGPTEGYGYQTPPQTLEASDEHKKVGAPVNDFPTGYHYRLVASNSAGVKLGRDKRYGKTGALKFLLPKGLTAIEYRHSFTLTGKLVGNGDEHVTVELQETPYPYLEAFANLGSTEQTGPDGTFSFRVSSQSQSAKFRVVAKEPRPIYSAILTQQVAPRITLKVSRTPVKGLVRLYGTITPAQTGARVLLQLDQAARPGNSEKASERTSRFTTQFSTIARHATKSLSRFSLIVTVTHAGEYRAYVQLHKGPLASGASQSVKLAAASSKRKKKSRA
jgi:hypothetical protein